MLEWPRPRRRTSGDQMQPSQRSTLISGVAAGVAYGAITWIAFGAAKSLPSMAFLVLVPAAMGATPLLFGDQAQVRWYARVLLIPWFTAFGFCVVLIAVFKEGGACLLVLAFPMIGFAMAGAFVVWLIGALRLKAKARAATAAALLLLPFLVLPVERIWFMPAEAGETLSSVVIEAPAGFVFDHLAAVPTITDLEYRPGLFNRLGVPRPVRATIDRAALGGKRVGEFEHGLRFDEEITRFDVPSLLSFSIAVDPARLRAGSAERHAFEAGYFRFVDATYRLEALGPVRTRLLLSSRYVLQSGWNSYGRFWAAALVGDFQDRVLAVIKQRSEPAVGNAVDTRTAIAP